MKEQQLSKKWWLSYIKNNSYTGMCAVNCKGRPQLKDHASLRKLIKSGVISVIRYGLPKSKRTYLIYRGNTFYQNQK